MPDTPSITVMKAITYRGVREPWGTTYHFTGTTPSDSAGWLNLLNAIWGVERTFMVADVGLIGGYGYVAGNKNSVWQANTDTVGLATTTGGATSGTQPPGDVAVWMRWATGKRNEKGRPVYGRNYYHGVPVGSTDSVATTPRTNMIAAGQKLVDGTLPGGFKKVLPQGDACTTVKVPTFTTTRTLKRRGKDPS